jgi:hypothetical protein
METGSNLKGDGPQMWEEHGKPVLLAVIDKSGFGRNFGWKVFLRDCHRRKLRSGDAAVVRVTAYHDETRRLSVKVDPSGGPYLYEVELSVGRTTTPWMQIRAALDRAILGLAPRRDAEPTPEEAPPPPPPPPPPAPADNGSVLAGIDLTKILKMREGLDTLLTVGKDIKDCEALKREAERAVAECRRAADPLKEAAEVAAFTAKRAAADVQAAQDKVARLNEELRRAMAERDQLAAVSTAASADRDRAEAAHAPARDALAAAEADLADVQRLEDERMRTLAQAGDVAVLLAALERLGK